MVNSTFKIYPRSEYFSISHHYHLNPSHHSFHHRLQQFLNLGTRHLGTVLLGGVGYSVCCRMPSSIYSLFPLGESSNASSIVVTTKSVTKQLKCLLGAKLPPVESQWIIAMASCSPCFLPSLPVVYPPSNKQLSCKHVDHFIPFLKTFQWLPISLGSNL